MILTNEQMFALVESSRHAASEIGAKRIFWFARPDDPGNPETEFHPEFSFVRDAYGELVEPFLIERVPFGDQPCKRPRPE